ncbi:MAG: AmmeMemoRadiSam system protein A, partial [Spirochaetes bacterium]|nr:AmmeMemoRadiSam system protein A [Spirochaetota bacterium]
MSVDQFAIDDQKLLLRCARDAIQAAFSRKAPPTVSVEAQLEIQRGLFVTLHKAGQLRGCIGRMNSAAPLIQTIQEMAVAAAFQDPRFPPLNQAELALVDIELSILSP